MSNGNVNVKFQSEVQEIADELVSVLVSKNADYGNSFDVLYDEWGISTVGIRLGDKYNRIKQLLNGNEAQVKTESLEDSLSDMAGYCFLALRKLNELKDKDGEIAPIIQ